METSKWRRDTDVSDVEAREVGGQLAGEPLGTEDFGGDVAGGHQGDLQLAGELASALGQLAGQE
jgi:hypothetical protein